MKKVEFKEQTYYFEDDVSNTLIITHMMTVAALKSILNEHWSCNWSLNGNVITISGDEDRHEIEIQTIAPIKVYKEKGFVRDCFIPGPVR